MSWTEQDWIERGKWLRRQQPTGRLWMCIVFAAIVAAGAAVAILTVLAANL